MASTKEIKSRMKSVRDTQKITNAMYMIASTKMRKAKLELDNTRPYFSALRAEIKRIFRADADVDSRYFYQDEAALKENGAYGCLVITADKGLAGAYNMNVIKLAQRLIEKHPNTKLFVVGEYGRQFFTNHRIAIEKSFLYTAQNPTMQRAREISSQLLSLFNDGTLDEIFIVYTDLKSSLAEKAVLARLLPLHRTHFVAHDDDQSTEFEFMPSAVEVLEHVIPSYISGFIYSALIDSFCSEQNARMAAMNSANSNIEEILEGLTVQFNRVRQSAITQEITEVASGAKAQRKKRSGEVLGQ